MLVFIILMILVIVFAVASFFMMFMKEIKNEVFPPCSDCAHCDNNNRYQYCKNVRDKIDGSLEPCSYARGTVHCWFKKNQCSKGE